MNEHRRDRHAQGQVQGPERQQNKQFQERMLGSFRYLCNTDSVNKQLSTQDVDELRSMIKQIPTPLNVNSDPTPTQSSMPKFTDRFKQRLQEESNGRENSEVGLEPASPTDVDAKDGSDSGSDAGSETGENSSVASQVSGDSRKSRASSSSQRSNPRKRRPETHEQTKMKRNFLVILRTLQKEGYQPTQEFTMDDSLQEIKEEVEQYYMCKEASSFVSKWKGNVEMGASLVEIGAQFIPKQPLKLQGLQSRIRKVHESKQVDIDWERIYYTYRRKKMTNPLWSLAITYGLAMLSTQITNYASAKLGSVLGGGGQSQGGDGGGGLDLGGIIGSLFGAFGSKPSDMPSMTTGLPGLSSSAPPESSEQQSSQIRQPPQPAPGPRRGFKRNVFFS